MAFLEAALRILHIEMETPTSYGWFHIVWLVISAACTVLAWIYGPKASEKQVRSIVFITGLVVFLLEIYKQIVYTFIPDDNGISASYQWYAFPFQFCSTPMYAGLLAGISRKGRFHRAICAYLATYAVFAGIAVMLYPVTVFTFTAGINIQTMICHGSMIPIGALLFSSGYIKPRFRTFLRALLVFICAVFIAVILNEIAYFSGLLETHNFNMFFISPHCDPSLPVYSLVQQYVPFPWCLSIYILGFSAAAFTILLIFRCMLQKKQSLHRQLIDK